MTIKTLTAAAAAALLALPAFAGELTEAEKAAHERLEAQMEAAKDLQPKGDADLVEKLASESTADVLLQKNVNNDQQEEVKEMIPASKREPSEVGDAGGEPATE